MALRNILKDGDPALRKICRPVTEFDEKLAQLLDDLGETLHHTDGVGLAAPQVGVLRRVFIMDFGDGIIEAVNPEIVSTKGMQEGPEGCLSFPGNTASSADRKKPSSKPRTVMESGLPLQGRIWWPAASAMRTTIWTGSFSSST